MNNNKLIIVLIMLTFLSSCSFKTNPAQKIAELFGSQTSQVSSTSDNDNVENNYSFGSLRSDMGIGFTCDLGQLVNDYYDFEKPLLFRLDFPFFLSDPANSENNIKFRWLFGINKTF